MDEKSYEKRPKKIKTCDKNSIKKGSKRDKKYKKESKKGPKVDQKQPNVLVKVNS